MDEITIKIRTGNDAFHPDKCKELSRILLNLTDRINTGFLSHLSDSTTLVDRNGNNVGYAKNDWDEDDAVAADPEPSSPKAPAWN